MMNMLFVIICRAWKTLFQGREKEQFVKLERQKTGGKEMKKKKTQQLNLLLEKQVIKGNVFELL